MHVLSFTLLHCFVFFSFLFKHSFCTVDIRLACLFLCAFEIDEGLERSSGKASNPSEILHKSAQPYDFASFAGRI